MKSGLIRRSAEKTSSFFTAVRNARSILDVVDAMIDIPSDAIDARVNELRRSNPGATPAQLCDLVTKRFRRLAASTSGVAGASAALPSVGTAASVGLSGAQLVAFVAEAGYYVLTLAHLHGVPVEDKDRRRLLILTALMGDEGAQIATSQFGFSTLTALKGYASDIQRRTIKRVNQVLAKRAARQVGRKGIAATIGRAFPFGIGAALGWVIGRSMANGVIEGARAALGPAPQEFTTPITIDVDVVESRVGTVPSSTGTSGIGHDR